MTKHGRISLILDIYMSPLTLFGVWRHLLHEGNEVEQELGVIVGQFQIIAVLPEEEQKAILRRKINK